MKYLRSSIHIENFDDLKKYESLIVSNELIIERTPEIEDLYKRSRIKAKELGINYAEKIRSELLNGKKWDLSLDEYPRDLPIDTQHWTLWIADYNISKENIEIILNDCLIEKSWNKKDVIFFEKLLENKSIPEIRHIHIYVRKKS